MRPRVVKEVTSGTKTAASMRAMSDPLRAEDTDERVYGMLTLATSCCDKHDRLRRAMLSYSLSASRRLVSWRSRFADAVHHQVDAVV